MSEEPFALTLHVPPPPAGDFDAIHDAVMETARGRWFLQEYARRHRNADTALVLAAIERIEAALRLQKSAPSPASGVAASVSDLPLMEIRDAIVLTRENLAAIKPDGSSDFKAADFERLAGAIEAAAAHMRTAGEHVQEVAWSMREQNGRPATPGVNESRCAELETQAREIAKNCALLEETGAGAKVVAALLQEIEDRINAMLAQPATPDAPVRPTAAAERPAPTPTEMPQDVAAGFAAAESASAESAKTVAAEPAPVAEAAATLIAEAVAENTSEIAAEETAPVIVAVAIVEPDAEPVAEAAAIEPPADLPQPAEEPAAALLMLETATTESAEQAIESEAQAGGQTEGDVTLVLTETLSIVVTPSAARSEPEEQSAAAAETVETASAKPSFADVTAQIRARYAHVDIAQGTTSAPREVEIAPAQEPAQEMPTPPAAAEASSSIEPPQAAPAAGIAAAAPAEAVTPQAKPRGMPGWLTMLAPLVRGRVAAEPAPPATKIDFRLDGALVVKAAPATPADTAHAERTAAPEPDAQAVAESPAPEDSAQALARQEGDEAILQARDILQGERERADSFAFQPGIGTDGDAAAVPEHAASDAPAATQTVASAAGQSVASETSAEEPADFLLEPWPRTPVHTGPQDMAPAQALDMPVAAAAPAESRAANPMSEAIARMAAASKPVSIPAAPAPEVTMTPPAIAAAPQEHAPSAETQPAGMPAALPAQPAVAEDDNVLASVIAPTSPLRPVVTRQPFRPIQIAKPGDPLAPIIALSEEEKIALFS